MTPPKTPVTQRPAETSDDTTTQTRPSPPNVDDHQPAAPGRVVDRAVSAGIAVALIAAVAILLSGLSDDGAGPAGPVGLRGAIPADVTTGDPAVGIEIFVEDLRSVGRIDPVAGREEYFEDLRSIGRNANVWRDAYFEDLRSIGRIDPVAGREAYFEDLRSIGR